MFESAPMISLFNLAIVAAVGFASVRLRHLSRQFVGERKGLACVFYGLVVIASYYAIDLLVLWANLPGSDSGSAILHLNYLRSNIRPFFVLTASILIAIGLQQLSSALFASREELRRQAEQARVREAENRVLLTQLHQNQKVESLGTLAGGIAHDFNNILSSIINSAELLQIYLGDDEKGRRNTDRIIKNGKKATELIRQILTFSRMDSQKLIPSDLSNLVTEDLEIVRATIPSFIEIESDLDTDTGNIMADRTQISQVTLNLVTNAYHAIGDKPGRISIRVKKLPSSGSREGPQESQVTEYVALIVEDDGCGMEPAVQARMFDPFFTTKEVGKGTGLGLSSVHGIIEGHKGTIAVESTPGSGTRITASFPLSKAAEQQEAPALTTTRISNKSILLVEDNPELGTLIKEHLERHGNRVNHQSDGIAALEEYRSSATGFDLLVTDQAVPSLSGRQLSMKLLDLKPDLPILMMTGYSETISEQEAKSMGISEFILKPFSLSDLDAAISRCTDSLHQADRTVTTAQSEA